MTESSKIVLNHASGARAEVYLHGAHVTSWVPPHGTEVLFLSRKTRMDGDAPIRGGVPIVFPQFAGLGDLPQHGFARTLSWELAERGDKEDGTVSARLSLSATDPTLALWPHRFLAELEVCLSQELEMTLSITNAGDAPFSFRSAFHTYFQIGNIRRVAVRGLEGAAYLAGDSDLPELAREVDPLLRIAREHDRIYLDVPDRLTIVDDQLERVITIHKTGFPDVVVWNPWTDRARAMMDLADDEYLRFLCLEPAQILPPVELGPAQTWRGSQRITVG